MCEKTVGIIGGLGPEATLDFYARLMEATEATDDQDHLHLIINSNAKIPNRQESIAGTGPSSVPGLIEAAVALERAGAEFLIMPCNTAHFYHEQMREHVSIPFLSIISESLKACHEIAPRGAKIGLMATDACLNVDLFQSAMRASGFDLVLPNDIEQAQLMRDIFRIKTGTIEPAIPVNMRKLTQSLHDRGATVILTACTEIPLALPAEDAVVPMIHSTDALIKATIDYARGDYVS